MKLETLDTLNDQDLQAVIVRSTDLLKDRDVKRKAKAREDATAILLAAGLTPKDLTKSEAKGRSKSRRDEGPKFHANHVYEHPEDASKKWKGTGVKPEWVKELLKAGRMPVDKGAVLQVAEKRTA